MCMKEFAISRCSAQASKGMLAARDVSPHLQRRRLQRRCIRLWDAAAIVTAQPDERGIVEARPLACWEVGAETKIVAAAQGLDGRQWLVLDAAGALKLVACPAGSSLADAFSRMLWEVQVLVVPL